ncbi:soluble pyridine nucleotide transhydrogenase [Teredinibacter turnerae T7901]|uniref:Soluble pyridine nucleotide transhydrogenase n=1 Tax=Teredinibacter turnerae (strain ATCC 39867 / T7901) TaxID=377629 RepID=C5BII9_TERTT|nr:Si-specific NAD(P)(+) transhydrogenase [Teredinibacter turnerae]ACR13070.1 soluble pyridine nucleotide transhydrogenase [Teredinibacter turnerae T7901]
MSDFEYDLLVIGAGPAGESAAMAGVKNGLRVGVVEAHNMLGGNCAHRGTIPSKALRNAVKQAIAYHSHPLFRHIHDSQPLTYPRILEAASQVIPKQVELHTEYFTRNRIRVHEGVASFLAKDKVEVIDSQGARDVVAAKDILIATGSRPYRPTDIDFDHPRVYDSDTILEMKHTPRTLIVFGAGVIGCEYASIFSGLGLKVDLINGRERLLSFLDDEISDALSYHLRNNGVMVRHSESHDRLECDDHGVTLYLKSGKRIRADALLWCNGRTGNTDSLNLEKIGLAANHRGQIKVDKAYRTEIENIYAAGDVIGWPSLASASFDQGRSVVAAIQNREVRFVENAPTGIYTIPEISSVGRTESELTAAQIPYEVGRAFFKDTARAQISGEDVGMLKILFHVDTHEILGIHCFGAEASEIVHIGQAIMQQPGEANNISYFATSTFNYPTMAEAYRVAALNGLNRVNRR